MIGVRHLDEATGAWTVEHVEHTWSPIARDEDGRWISEPVGIEDGRPTTAALHEDGLWTWHGFYYATLAAAKHAARKGGY